MALLLVSLGTGQASTGAVARLKAASGAVQYRRGAEGAWQRARQGQELTLADSVRTQKGALARIEFYDAIDGAEATVVDLADAAEVSIAQFEISRSLPKRRMGLLDVVYGTLRAFTKGWRRGSVFSVRAGTTVCGIRGSAAVISVSPTGRVAFTGVDGKMFTFQINTQAPDFAGLSGPAFSRAVQAAAIQTSAQIATGIESGQSLSDIPLPLTTGTANELPPGTQEVAGVTGVGGVQRVTMNPATFKVIQAAEKAARTSPNAKVILTVGGTDPDSVGTTLEVEGGGEATTIDGPVQLQQGERTGSAEQILNNVIDETVGSQNNQGGTTDQDTYNGADG